MAETPDGAGLPNRLPSGQPTFGLEPPTTPLRAVPAAAAYPIRAVPEMFPTEMMAPSAVRSPTNGPRAWSEAPEPMAPQGVSVQSTELPGGLFPGWTGMYPAVATPGAGAGLSPRPERRKRALIGVGAVVAVTAVVVGAALLFAPLWNGSANVADDNGRPGTTAATPAATTGSSATTDGTLAPSSVLTVTVTATGASATGPAGTAAGAGTARPGTDAPVTRATAATATSPTVTSPTVTSATGGKPTKAPGHKPPKKLPPRAAANPLGVPQRDIRCASGYIVQLASELDAATFARRVAELKAARLVPAGAAAADSARSCQIFSNQSNTLVLYAGPYRGQYDGCAARLAGPADAFIKGADPGNSRAYISCLCPADAGRLPQITSVGQQGVWIGEAQRALGNRLNVNIPDLDGHWGVFTQGTRDAVRRFQKSAGVPATGALDTRTWGKLQSAQC